MDSTGTSAVEAVHLSVGSARAWLVAAAVTLLGMCWAPATWAAPTQSANVLSQARIQLDGAAAGDSAGFSVSKAGDVNGDRRPDVILGARNVDNNGRNESGSSYVLFGQTSPTTIDLARLDRQGFRIDGAAVDDHAGAAVAGGRDVNRDGLADVIVGAYRAESNRRYNSGSTYVVFGKASTSTVDLAALGTQGFRIDGAAVEDFSGTAVAAARDMNGDSRADLIIGAPFADNNGRADSGSTYVVFGKASSTTVDLARLDKQGFRIDGAAAGDQMGTSVAGSGDLNGDGRPDLVTGAPFSDNHGSESGSAYVVFGKVSTTTVDLAALGAQGFRIDGAVRDDRAGFSVAGASDVNGDGKEDVVVGAPYADNNSRLESGSTYVVFGKSSPDMVDLALPGTWGFRIDGGKGDQAGSSVAGPGDVNRDGRPDLLLGARNAAYSGNSAGSAYLVFGATSTATVDLAALGSRGYRIDGAAGGDQFGFSVAGAGDVNGDGRPDLMIGARWADNNGRDKSGSAYVLFGS